MPAAAANDPGCDVRGLADEVEANLDLDRIFELLDLTAAAPASAAVRI